MNKETLRGRGNKKEKAEGNDINEDRSRKGTVIQFEWQLSHVVTRGKLVTIT